MIACLAPRPNRVGVMLPAKPLMNFWRWLITMRLACLSWCSAYLTPFGPRQRGQYGMVVPRFVQWALNHAPLQVYGNGSQDAQLRQCV